MQAAQHEEETPVLTDSRGIPLDLPEKERPLYEMFVESTGTHFLDSGGTSGRAWQRNRRRDLRKDPVAEIDFYVAGRRFEYVSLSTYHFMRDRLIYDEQMSKIFEKWSRRKSNENLSLYQQMEEFVPWLVKMLPNADIHHPYDRSDPTGLYVYTYNEENLLNQDFQYVAFECNNTEYYLISLHGGADARVGFTDPRMFTGNGMSEWAALDYRNASLVCDYTEREALRKKLDEEEARQPLLIREEPKPWVDCHIWDCDGGSDFHAQHYPTNGTPSRFPKDVRFVLAPDHDEYDEEIDDPDRSTDKRYVSVVDKDGNLHCPAPGCGCTLQAFPR